MLGELLYALDVSTDPEKEKNKFYKSAYKILNKMRKHIEKKVKNENLRFGTISFFHYPKD